MPTLSNHEVGPVANPRLCITVEESGSVEYKWQVFFNTISSGCLSETLLRQHLDELRPHSGYVICPGIRSYPEEVRFVTKNARLWGIPFNRIDAHSCRLWHIPNNVKHPTGTELRDTCKECRLLHHDIMKLASNYREEIG